MKTAFAPILSIASFISLLFVLAWALLAAARADQPDANWPQWRGPLASGGSATADPVTAWGEDNNVKWKIKLDGSGTATPIVWGDKIFIASAVNTKAKPAAAAAPADKGDKGNGSQTATPAQPGRFALVLAEPEAEPAPPLSEFQKRYDTDKCLSRGQVICIPLN